MGIPAGQSHAIVADHGQVLGHLEAEQGSGILDADGHEVIGADDDVWAAAAQQQDGFLVAGLVGVVAVLDDVEGEAMGIERGSEPAHALLVDMARGAAGEVDEMAASILYERIDHFRRRGAGIEAHV